MDEKADSFIFPLTNKCKNKMSSESFNFNYFVLIMTWTKASWRSNKVDRLISKMFHLYEISLLLIHIKTHFQKILSKYNLRYYLDVTNVSSYLIKINSDILIDTLLRFFRLLTKILCVGIYYSKYITALMYFSG